MVALEIFFLCQVWFFNSNMFRLSMELRHYWIPGLLLFHLSWSKPDIFSDLLGKMGNPHCLIFAHTFTVYFRKRIICTNHSSAITLLEFWVIVSTLRI